MGSVLERLPAYAELLRRLDDATLGKLLQSRPEAAAMTDGRPAAWTMLSALLGRQESLWRVLSEANLLQRQALELACVAGGQLPEATAAAQGLDSHRFSLVSAELAERGLAFRDGDVL